MAKIETMDHTPIDVPSMVIVSVSGYMDRFDPPRKVTYHHAVRWTLKPETQDDWRSHRYALFGTDDIPGSVRGFLVSVAGTSDLVPYFIAGESAGTKVPNVWIHRMLSYATDPKRPPMVWGAMRMAHLHVGARTLPPVPERPTDEQRFHLGVLGFSLYVDHLDNNGQACEYSGTVAGPSYDVHPCPRCGETRAERVPRVKHGSVTALTADASWAVADIAKSRLTDAGMI